MVLTNLDTLPGIVVHSKPMNANLQYRDTITDFSYTLEDLSIRWVICKIIRLGYMPTGNRYTDGVSDSDGYWKHLVCGICWLTKPNPAAKGE